MKPEKFQHAILVQPDLSMSNEQYLGKFLYAISFFIYLM